MTHVVFYKSYRLFTDRPTNYLIPFFRGVGPYDIAMMRTSRNIEFSQEVQPINLPLVPTRDETTPENLLITGWGALQSTFFVTVLPTKLQEAEVTYLPYYGKL